jgi:hypothetical protein
VLLVSLAGYSLTDPWTGERLVRDRDAERAEAAFSRARLTFTVPATRDEVPVFGLPGGDGLHQTPDGWSVEIVYPWWPVPAVMLVPPQGPGTRYLDGAHVLDLPGLGTPLGCGFSPSGRLLMVLDSAGAHLFSR